MTAGSIAVLADEEGILVSAGTRLSFSAYQAEEIMAALCLLETPHVAAVGQLADHIVAARTVGPNAAAVDRCVLAEGMSHAAS
jgi:hypothetical protein